MSTKVNSKHWQVLGEHQRHAAVVLRDAKLARASVGRAYYAAYSLLTAELLAAGVDNFGRFKNPDHADLPLLVRTRVTRLKPRVRSEISQSLRFLRTMREDADYRPGREISASDALEAARALVTIERGLEVKP